MEAAELVQIPEWEQYRWLRHGFSRRGGGISAVYFTGSGGIGELNLGWTKEDDPAIVAENRQRFVTAVSDGTDFALVTTRQVHGAVTQAVRENDRAREGWLETAGGKAVLEGDGLMTSVPGVLL